MKKILFISRSTLWSTAGGDTVQIEQTAAALRRLDICVDIKCTGDPAIRYGDYQLIHFFNIIRPADILVHIERSGLPYVVSPVYVEYDQINSLLPTSFLQRSLSLLSKNGQEYLKCIARAVKNNERIASPKYIYWGHKRSIEYILHHCAMLLPNSQSEYERIKRDFNSAGAYTTIPNAVDTQRFCMDENINRKNLSVLCVARFEPRKNQLQLIRALKDTPFRLTLAGNIAPNHRKYYEQCRASAGSNVCFLDFISHDTLPDLYRKHKVHILASWFETTGLSSLEAAACGCNIVITDKGDTKAYFGQHAIYCDPGDDKSILAAVRQAMSEETDIDFIRYIDKHYSWEAAAGMTLAAYKKVLNR